MLLKDLIPNVSNKKIPINYLENNQNIITIYYKEWIELFKQLNYTMKYISEVLSNPNISREIR